MQKKFALCWGLLTSFLKWQKTLAFYSGKEFEASMFKSTYYHQTSSDLSITSSCMIIIEIESGIKKNLCFSSMKWIFLARNLNSRHIYIFLYIIWWIHYVPMQEHVWYLSTYISILFKLTFVNKYLSIWHQTWLNYETYVKATASLLLSRQTLYLIDIL